MKRIFFAALVLMATNTFAQTEKGNWLVGGMVGLETQTGTSNITFSPNVGYFIKNNFVAGVDLGLSSTKVNTQTTTDIDLGPFARYYFGHANFRPFTMLKISYLTENVKDSDPTDISITQIGFGYILGVGGSAFISPDVSFDGMFGYRYSQYETAESSKGLSLKFGFQVYLNTHKMKSLKKLRKN